MTPLPPDVREALRGQRPTFAAKAPRPLRRGRALKRALGGAAGLLFVALAGAVVLNSVLQGNVTVSANGGPPQAVAPGDPRAVSIVVGVALLLGLAAGAALVSGLRGLRPEGPWVVATSEGLHVVGRKARFHPWSGFSGARRSGRAVLLEPRAVRLTGLLSPDRSGALELPPVEDAAGLLDACHAGLNATAPAAGPATPRAPPATPPPHVEAALRGARPDFLVKGGGPHGAILVGAGVLSAVVGAFFAWSVAFGEGAVRMGEDGTALSEAARRWVALGVLAFVLANGAFLAWAGQRVLRDQKTWYAGTPEGLIVVTPKGRLVEPWSSFEDARVEKRDVFLLVPRVGIRGPVKHILRGVEEPERVAEACRARIGASSRGEGRLSRLLGV